MNVQASYGPPCSAPPLPLMSLRIAFYFLYKLLAKINFQEQQGIWWTQRGTKRYSLSGFRTQQQTNCRLYRFRKLDEFQAAQVSVDGAKAELETQLRNLELVSDFRLTFLLH